MNLTVNTLVKAITNRISTNIRSSEEVFNFILESGYELLPYGLRLVIKKEVFTDFCINRKTDLMQAVWIKCNGCGAGKVVYSSCGYCGQ